MKNNSDRIIGTYYIYLSTFFMYFCQIKLQMSYFFYKSYLSSGFYFTSKFSTYDHFITYSWRLQGDFAVAFSFKFRNNLRNYQTILL